MRNRNALKTVLRIIFFPITVILQLFRLVSRKIGFSIRLKLSLVYIRILLISLLLATLGIVTIFGAYKFYYALSADYGRLEEILLDNGDYSSRLKEYALEHGLDIAVFGEDEELVFSSQPAFDQYGYRKTVGFETPGGELHLVLNGRVLLRNGLPKTLLYYNVQQPIDEIVRLLKIILGVFAFTAFFAIVSIAGSGRQVFHPIREMTDTVRGISEGNLNVRLNVSGAKDELKVLAMTFNEMMNRIEDDYNRQKQFVSDASHELRTPIAIIHGYADMLDRWGKNDKAVLQESIEAIKNESESMKDLVEKLLFLARSDKNTLALQKEEFSLNEMMDEVIKEAGIIDRYHEFVYSTGNEIPIYADRNRIKQAIRIFVDNAMKYTPYGGKIFLTLEDEGDTVRIGIKDTGIGMSKEELRHIFDRFYRAEKSRRGTEGGHGLGLAIAKIIVLGHKGKINVRSKKGEGSEFNIILPKERGRPNAP